MTHTHTHPVIFFFSRARRRWLVVDLEGVRGCGPQDGLAHQNYPPPWPIAYGAVPGRAGDACDPAWDASCFEGVRPVSIACSLPSACIWSVISRIISMVTWSGLAFRFRFGFRLRFGLGFGLELGLGLGLGLD